MNEAISSLVDIVEPGMPVIIDAGFSLLIPGIVFALALMAALWWWHRGRQPRCARAQLRRLQQNYIDGELTQRELAYRLAAQLRAYSGHNRLRAQRAPPSADTAQQAAWPTFLQQLDALRYQPNHEVDMTALLAQARRWLR